MQNSSQSSPLIKVYTSLGSMILSGRGKGKHGGREREREGGRGMEEEGDVYYTDNPPLDKGILEHQ